MKLLGRPELFGASDVFPILAIASVSPITKTKDSAEMNVKSLFMSLDTRDLSLSEKLYRLIFSETYIYRDFKEREDQ